MRKKESLLIKSLKNNKIDFDSINNNDINYERASLNSTLLTCVVGVTSAAGVTSTAGVTSGTSAMGAESATRGAGRGRRDRCFLILLLVG